jgi:hypothetical protein
MFLRCMAARDSAITCACRIIARIGKGTIVEAKWTVDDSHPCSFWYADEWRKPEPNRILVWSHFSRKRWTADSDDGTKRVFYWRWECALKHPDGKRRNGVSFERPIIRGGSQDGYHACMHNLRKHWEKYHRPRNRVWDLHPNRIYVEE